MQGGSPARGQVVTLALEVHRDVVLGDLARRDFVGIEAEDASDYGQAAREHGTDEGADALALVPEIRALVDEHERHGRVVALNGPQVQVLHGLVEAL